MTRAPLVLAKPDAPYARGDRTVHDTTLGWRFVNPRYEERYSRESMGETGENVADRWGVSREDQDAFALRSQQRWAAAQEADRFADELVPAGDLEHDEHPRPDTSLDKLSSLRPAFRAGGTVTAGNASGIVDGGAAVILASESAAQARGLTPLARLAGWATVGLDPSIMGMGPAPAIRKLLQQKQLTLDDIDLFEINEAFAAQYLAVEKELGLNREKVNVNGGAIALGHPLGATGARILLTLTLEMRRRGARRGIAAACIGGGQGIAALVESL